MRKVLLPLLLATSAAVAAAPAHSAPRDRDERAETREDRQSKRSESREDRQSKRSEARESRGDAQQERAQVREERVQQRAAQHEAGGRPALKADRSAIIDRRDERRELIDQRRQSRAAGAEQRREAVDTLADQREQSRQQRQEAREQLQQQRQESRERFAQRVREGRRLPPPPGARPDRPAPPPPAVVESRQPAPSWSATHWRRDNRYDWRRWRDRNRGLFRLGFYFDPFGWGYHRWGIGWRLWPAYYNEYYWLDDPWMYRLPYAPWPYRWVRYYDDAILVNVFTGQVVDVEYNFFW